MGLFDKIKKGLSGTPDYDGPRTSDEPYDDSSDSDDGGDSGD